MREFRERRRKEGKGGKRKGARGQSPQSPGELSGPGPPRPPQLDRRRLSVFSPATRKKKLVDLSLRDLRPLLPTSQPRGNRAPSTHSRQATVTNRASDFGTSTAASPSILARVGKKRALSRRLPRKSGFCLGASPSNQWRLSPRRLSTFRNVETLENAKM